MSKDPMFILELSCFIREVESNDGWELKNNISFEFVSEAVRIALL